MDLKLKGKVVGITGGTSGIGEELALAFAREGCKVAVCGRNQAKIEAMKERFMAEGMDLFIMQTDVAVNAELKAFVEAIVKEYGRLDIFINMPALTTASPSIPCPKMSGTSL